MSHSVHTATHHNAGISALGNIRTRGNATIKSYADCLAFWNKHEAGFKKSAEDDGTYELPLASNVRLILHAKDFSNPEKFSIRLYRTDIVFYWPDETFMATLGPVIEKGKNKGRQIGSTPMTVNRIDQFAPGEGRGRYGRFEWKLWGRGSEERVPVARS